MGRPISRPELEADRIMARQRHLPAQLERARQRVVDLETRARALGLHELVA